MLLAVEGGGFFSSSASGYSHGLALLLLGRKNEEKPVKVSPWNQYRLVEREEKETHQLASCKDQVSCKCTAFGCFGCVPATLDDPLNARQSPACQSEKKLRGTKAVYRNNGAGDKRGCLKSNLKRDSSDQCLVFNDSAVDARESVDEGQNGNGVERRKVQWTDTCGKELVEIREFEASERGASDDELETEGFKKCECTVM